MSESVKERSDDIVGVGGRDDDDQWKKTKQRGHGFGRNLKKAKRVSLFRFRKANKQLLRKNTRSGGSAGAGGCYCCFKQTPALDSPVESQTSDPNSPEFTCSIVADESERFRAPHVQSKALTCQAFVAEQYI